MFSSRLFPILLMSFLLVPFHSSCKKKSSKQVPQRRATVKKKSLKKRLPPQPRKKAIAPVVELAQKGRYSKELLTNYFTGTPLEGLENSLKQNVCNEIEDMAKRKKLKGRLAYAYHFALGLCYIKSERFSAAIPHLERAWRWKGLLQDEIAFWLGQAEIKNKKMSKALVWLKKVGKSSSFFTKAHLQVAKLLLKRGKAQQAIDFLKAMKLAEKDVAGMRLLAKAYLKLARQKFTKSPKKARKLRQLRRKWRRQGFAYIRKILVHFPLSGEALAYEKLRREGKLKLRLSSEEKILRAAALNSHFDYKGAIKTLQSVRLHRKLSSKVRCQFYYHRGFAWFRQRRYRQAIPSLRRAEQLCRRFPYEGIRSLYRLAQAYRRRGSLRLSMRYFKKLAKRYPKHYLADDAVFSVALFWERLGKLKKAKKAYTRLLKDFPQGDMAGVARWRLAYRAYRQQQWQAATRDFGRIYNLFPKDRYAPPALYYSARLLEKIKSSKKVILKRYLRLIRSYPLHFYSFLAIARLKNLTKKKISFPKRGKNLIPKKALLLPWGPLPSKPLDLDEIEKAFEGRSASFIKSLRYQKGVEFYRLGLLKEAAEEWAQLLDCRYFPNAQTRRRCGYRGDEGAELLALHFRKAGVYHLADRVYRRRGKIAGYLRFEPKTFASWYLAYPRPFGGFVNNYANQDKIPTSLVYGLMREESTFNPQIQSWANAYGLMQLLYPTAKAAARTKPNPLPFHPNLKVEDLLTPEINIRLGIRHLRMLYRQFDGKLPMMIGAYNAGSRWVKRWLKRSPKLPLDEWIETISIKQTRHYVKRVLQSYAIYHFLYGPKGDTVGLLPPLDPTWIPGELLTYPH